MLGVKRALVLSTGDKYFSFVVNFVTVAAVSRILSPGEIGVSVIGMAIVGLALAVREFASGSFLIQQVELPRDVVRSAFTAMLIITAAIALVLVAIAPLLAAAYGEQNLVPYLHLISICLLIDLVPQQISTLLRRDMAFGRVAAINVTVSAVGAIATITLAFLGFSYMSFAWGWLMASVAGTTLAVVIFPHFWMFKPSFAQLRSIAKFGGYNGATSILYKLQEGLPYILLGHFVSPGASALLQRSSMICLIPDKIILGGATAVILPAFATEIRQGRSLREPYLRAIEFITALQWPALVTLGLLAEPVVDLLLGSDWGGVVPLVRVMALATLFTFSFELNYPVLVAVGAIRDVFRRAIFVFPVSAIILGVASMFGPQAVAWGMVVVVPFSALVSLQLVRKRLAVSWRDIGASLWRSGVVAVASALGPLCVVSANNFTFDMSFGEAVIAGCLAGVGWVTGLWVVQHPLLIMLAKHLPMLRRTAFQQP